MRKQYSRLSSQTGPESQKNETSAQISRGWKNSVRSSYRLLERIFRLYVYWNVRNTAECLLQMVRQNRILCKPRGGTSAVPGGFLLQQFLCQSADCVRHFFQHYGVTSGHGVASHRLALHHVVELHQLAATMRFRNAKTNGAKISRNVRNVILVQLLLGNRSVIRKPLQAQQPDYVGLGFFQRRKIAANRFANLLFAPSDSRIIRTQLM